MDKTIVRISYSNKEGQRLLNAAIETEVESVFKEDVMNDITDKLMKHVDTKLESTKAEQTIRNQFPSNTPDRNEGLGTCNKCGSPMVNNPRTGKNFCKEKCWLK